jgi:hypothetical protein
MKRVVYVCRAACGQLLAPILADTRRAARERAAAWLSVRLTIVLGRCRRLAWSQLVALGLDVVPVRRVRKVGEIRTKTIV